MKNRGREKCLKIKNNFTGNEKRESLSVKSVNHIYITKNQ